MTFPDNAPMRRLAARLGFQDEGTLRSYTLERGRRQTFVLSSLLREELERARRGSSAAYPPDPGSAILLWAAALSESGMRRLTRPWIFVVSELASTRSLPSMSPSKP